MDRVARMIRFACVGASVAALYILLYLVFLHIGWAQWVANGVAFLLAVSVQYVGQAGVTFKARINDRAQVLRFAVMIGLGLLTSAGITGLLAPILGLADWLAAGIVTLVLPIQNYVILSRWVFAQGSTWMEPAK